MILTKGDLYHSALWKLWFQYLEGFVPLAQVQSACSGDQELDPAQEMCRAHYDAGGSVLTRQVQHLFTVYVHVGLNNVTFNGALLPFRKGFLKFAEPAGSIPLSSSSHRIN